MLAKTHALEVSSEKSCCAMSRAGLGTGKTMSGMLSADRDFGSATKIAFPTSMLFVTFLASKISAMSLSLNSSSRSRLDVSVIIVLIEVLDEFCDPPSEELAGPALSDVPVLADALESCRRLVRFLEAFSRFSALRMPAAVRFIMVDIDSPSVSWYAAVAESRYAEATRQPSSSVLCPTNMSHSSSSIVSKVGQPNRDKGRSNVRDTDVDRSIESGTRWKSVSDAPRAAGHEKRQAGTSQGSCWDPVPEDVWGAVECLEFLALRLGVPQVLSSNETLSVLSASLTSLEVCPLSIFQDRASIPFATCPRKSGNFGILKRYSGSLGSATVFSSCHSLYSQMMIMPSIRVSTAQVIINAMVTPGTFCIRLAATFSCEVGER